jgi:hypothetical protein
MARRRSLPLPGTRSEATRKHVLAAIAEGRRGGLSGSATKADVLRIGDVRGTPFSRRSLDKYGSEAFRPTGRRSVLLASDRIQRRADVITYQRGVEFDRVVRSSRDASKVGQWQNAVKAFLTTGEEGPLRDLSERDRTIDGGRSVLVNDPDEIQALADSGALDSFRVEAGS